MNRQNDFSLSTSDIFDGRYYCVNKRLLQLVGQWPYQYNRERLVKFLIILTLGGFCLWAQVRALILAWGKLDAIVACATPLIANVGSLYMLMNSEYHIQQMRKIVDQTMKNWDSVRGMPQLQILRDHGETGRLYTLVYSMACYAAIASWLLTPLMPKFLDLVVPLNQSRKRLEVIPTDYSIDSDKFFWPIYLHLGATIIMVLSIIVAIDAFYMSLAQHACGMFEILRHDVQNVLQADDINTNVVLQPNYQADVTYHHIISCMKRHKSIVE